MGKHCLRSVILFFLSLLIIPCLLSSAYALDSEIRTLKSFDTVKVSGPIKLFLSEGSGESVKITVEGDDPDKIVTEVTGKNLEIKPKTVSIIESDVEFRVYVTYKKLRKLRCSNGAEAQGESVIKGDKFEVEVANSGIVDIQVNVSTLSCNVTSAGNLTVSGRAQDQKSVINTTGTMHAFKLICDNAYVKVGTGGSAEIYAAELIEGSVKTAGSLTFKGDPKKQRVDKSTGGKIKEIQ